MKFNLNEIENLIKEAEERKERNEENTNIYNKYCKIVEGVASKYGKTKWVNREDLEQILWEKILKLVRKYGIENVNESIAARSCWNMAVDFYRSARKNYERKAQYIEITGEAEELVGNENLVSKVETGDERLVVREIIEIFPEGSKEWKFLVMKLYTGGFIDDNLLIKHKIEVKPYKTDASIAYGLGYKSPCPGSFRSMKIKIMSEVHKIMNIK